MSATILCLSLVPCLALVPPRPVGAGLAAAAPAAAVVAQDPAARDEQEPVEAVQEEGRDLLEALRTLTIERRGELLEAAEAEFVSLDERIGQLRQRLSEGWQGMDETTRERAAASLRAIERSRAELAQWLERVRRSSRPGWEQMKEGFGEAYAGLVEMIRSIPETGD